MKAKTLKLSKNQSSLPSEILFEGFTHLEVFGGNLESLDERWFSIPTLEVLRLKNVGLVELPANINFLAPKLHTLVLSQNHLIDIPEWITNFPALKVLDISSNNISKLPQSWATTLQRFVADSNEIVDLPIGLLEIPSLLHLSLDENPLSEDSKQQVFQKFGILI